MYDDNEDFQFEWRIENFTFAAHRTGQFITSPAFCADILDETQWVLLLYPRGQKNEEYIDIAVKREAYDHGGDEMHIKCAVELEAVDSTHHERVESDTIAFRNNTSHVFLKFIKRSELFNMKDTLLPNDRLTIHCNLRRIQETSVKDLVAVTKIGLKKSVFEWCIPNWSRIQLPATCDPDVIEAPYITHVTFPSDAKPLFRLYLCRNRNEDVDLRLDIVKLDPNLKTVLKSHITVLEDEDKEAFTVETTHQFHSVESLGTTCYSSSPLFPSSDVPSMPNDVLTLQCILAIPTGSYQNTVQPVDLDSTEDEPKTDNSVDDCFKRDLENLLKEGKFCDVKLRAGGTEVPCHKFILFARSPVLNQMIDELDEMREEDDPVETEIDFDDLDGDTLKQMVQFLYTERIENIAYDSALKLLAAAQKFKVLDLKERCSEYLRAAFSFQNIFATIAAADRHQDNDLMKYALEYISKYWREISTTKEWEAFIKEQPNLHRRVCQLLRSGILC
ncbi:UNVERIFIED_CONTAM: mel-26 [Trichonephila clavipes]